jgi:hypothetical protein
LVLLARSNSANIPDEKSTFGAFFLPKIKFI